MNNSNVIEKRHLTDNTKLTHYYLFSKDDLYDYMLFSDIDRKKIVYHLINKSAVGPINSDAVILDKK